MTLALEPLAEAHAEELVEPLSDERLYAFIPGRPPAGVEALRHRYRFLASGRSPDGRQRWLNWVMRDGAAAVGTLQATVEGATADVAYVVFTDHQRRGHATAGVRWLLDWLRAEGVTLVRATVDTRNAPSIALLRRAGFALVSTGEADDMPGHQEHRYALSL